MIGKQLADIFGWRISVSLISKRTQFYYQHVQFILSLSLIIFSFQCSSPSSSRQKYLETYIHGDSINSKFKEADSLRYFGYYTSAINSYSLISDSLSNQERRYLSLQKAFCQSYSVDTIGLSKKILLIREEFDDGGFNSTEKAYYFLVAGRLEMLSDNTKAGLLALHESKSTFGTIVNEHFLKFMVFKDLAYYHRRISARIDSAIVYFELAQDIADKHLNLTYSTRDFYLDRADLYLVNRDYQSGLNQIDYVMDRIKLQNEVDSSFWIKSLLIKGKMLRFIGRKGEADSLMYQASDVLSKIKVETSLKADWYLQLILNATKEKDSVAFFNLISTFSEMQEELALGFYNINRLKGYYYYSQSNFELAIRYYKSMVSEFEVEDEFDIVQLMEGFYILSDSYLHLEDYRNAEHYAYESLVHETIHNNKPMSWSHVVSNEVAGELYNFINYAQLSNIYLNQFQKGNGDMDRLEKALQLYDIIDSVMIKQVKVIEEDAVLNFLNIAHGIYSDAIRVAFNLYNHSKSMKHLSKIHYFIEQSKGLLVFRDILSIDYNLFPEVPQPFREKELLLKSEISALKRELAVSGDKGKKSRLKSLLQDQNEHFRTMADLYPNYFAKKYERKIPTSHEILNIADSLDAAIVTFHVDGSDIFEMVYCKGKMTVHWINMDSVLSETIDEFNQRVSNPRSIVDSISFSLYQHQGFDLYKKLIAPIDQLIESKRLILIPDGQLNDVPFEALVTRTAFGTIDYRSVNYLIKKNQISYERSLSAIVRNAERKQDFKNPRILAYSYSGDQTKSRKFSGNSSLPELNYSFKEISNIKFVFGESGNQFRYASSATKEQFELDIKEDYDIIHLAMHASSSTSDRLNNRIYFRESTNETDVENALYGYEIFPMDFSNDLVVLSSCQSITGPSLRGEGTYNLARAFTQGGAAKIVATMWEINDFQTSQIINSFYINLKQTGNPSHALHMAKIIYIQNSDEYGANPFYWSGLVCYGF